jgi:hypothetical protein
MAYAHPSMVRRVFEENYTIGTRSCDDESISTCPFTEGTTKGWDASYAYAARSTSASEYLAPTICMDTGSPDVAKPQGTAGRGQMWRLHKGQAEIVDVYSGVCLTILLGTHFQFRSFGYEPLAAIGVTMPPWPGEGEATIVTGEWQPTVS